MARGALGQRRIGMVRRYPKSWDSFVREEFNYIITVCDRAADRCPVFPGDPERIHWSCDDPAAVRGTPEECQRAFDRVATPLVSRMRIWLSLPTIGGAIRR
jgi:arsenate reductase